jgi:predicted ATPase with chaperone activity
LNTLTKISATRFTGSPNPSSIRASRYAPRLSNVTPDNLDVNIDDTDTDTNSDSDKEVSPNIKAIKDAVKKAVKKVTKNKATTTSNDSKVAKPDLYYRERSKFEA